MGRAVYESALGISTGIAQYEALEQAHRKGIALGSPLQLIYLVLQVMSRFMQPNISSQSYAASNFLQACSSSMSTGHHGPLIACLSRGHWMTKPV